MSPFVVRYLFLIALVAIATSTFAQKIEGTWERTQYKFKRPHDASSKPESKGKAEKILVFDSASTFTTIFYTPDGACQFDSTCELQMEFDVDMADFSEKKFYRDNNQRKSIKGKYTVQGDSVILHGLSCYHHIHVDGDHLKVTYYESNEGKSKLIGYEKYVRRKEAVE